MVCDYVSSDDDIRHEMVTKCITIKILRNIVKCTKIDEKN